MNYFALWAQGSRCFEQLKVVVGMKDYGLWAQGSRYNEQLRGLDDMSYSMS